MSWADAFEQLGVVVASRDHLLASGASGRALTAAVQSGQLIRVRRDHYVLPGTPAPIVRAVRIGGRLGCVSALAHHGVFAISATATHAHLDRRTSRPRHPEHRRRPLSRSRAGVTLHWGELLDPDRGDECSVGIRDALAQAVRCQGPRLAVASLDNARFLGLIDDEDLGEIFAHLPGRYRSLQRMIDSRAESGQETVLRLALDDAGLSCEPQVTIPGVGRVDLVVNGRVIVEADSRLAHDGWSAHVRDRDRDLAAARLGYATLRPVYHRTMSETASVVDAVASLLRAFEHPRS